MDYTDLIDPLEKAARDAGAAIMRLHGNVDAAAKTDGSPVTEADHAAEKILLAALGQVAADIAIVSEENALSHEMAPPDRFFLVDPLDGTKEFLRNDRHGAFTVNIALVETGVAIIGIVYAPALGRLFSGCAGTGASEVDNGQRRAIHVRPVPQQGPVAVASRSHRDPQTDQWLAENHVCETVSIGSSLKFCLLAAGEADLYPRFGPTMEWDTAAGDAILCAAGGRVTHPAGEPFRYGKPGYRNGPFIAHGGS